MTDTIYFLASGQLIKIGFSGNLERRLGNLRCASSIPVEMLGFVAGSRAQEQRLHQLVASKRAHGEWFVDCPEVRILVEKCLTAGLDFLGKDSVSEPLDPILDDARRVARAIAKYSAVICNGPINDRLKEIEQRYAISSGTLWRMCYQPGDFGMGAYVGLLIGARQFFRDLSIAIEKQSEAVALIMDGHRRRENNVAELETALGREPQRPILTAAFARRRDQEMRRVFLKQTKIKQGT